MGTIDMLTHDHLHMLSLLRGYQDKIYNSIMAKMAGEAFMYDRKFSPSTVVMFDVSDGKQAAVVLHDSSEYRRVRVQLIDDHGNPMSATRVMSLFDLSQYNANTMLVDRAARRSRQIETRKLADPEKVKSEFTKHRKEYSNFFDCRKVGVVARVHRHGRWFTVKVIDTHCSGGDSIVRRLRDDGREMPREWVVSPWELISYNATEVLREKSNPSVIPRRRRSSVFKDRCR